MSDPAHPVDAAADLWGDRAAALLLVIGAALPLVLAPMGHPAGPIAVAVAAVLWVTSDGLDLRDDGLSELEEAKRLYRHGDITLDEFETRADVLLDERKQQVRALSEEVNGVGPAISAELADHYNSPDELKRATPEDLREIHNVGPSLSQKIGSEIGTYGAEDLGESDDVLAEVSSA